MLLEHQGKRPRIHATAYIAPTATVCGDVRPRALAVLRLMTSSNFVGCSIGRSPGFAPLRILSTYYCCGRIG